jgi:glycogen operon protein
MAYVLEHRTNRVVGWGLPYPLGATPTATGVNFALYSKHAGEVFLLLFDAAGANPTDVIRLDQRTKFVWHALVQGVRPGQLYAYKVRGDHRPAEGLRFNEHKLLVDPYARALTGPVRNQDNLLLGYDASPDAGGDLSLHTRDDTAVVPKCIVVDDAFDWQGDTSPDVPLESLVVYEVHPKGFTAHPSSRVEHPGTYLGFIEKIPHLVQLGVNAVELLPVHEFYVDDFLLQRGLTNYWGYNSIGFFAPTCFYGTGRTPGCQVVEFKTLVRELHRAGLKVILDVVYNHTGEGNECGPTISFRGIDNPSYYALSGPADAPGRYYMNWTGCGNSLDFDDRAVIRLVMDSLRYWVEQMHVDGFRFDLASVLGRAGPGGGFQSSSAFFDAVAQDPVLQRAILVAEPWDLGTYQVGNFPVDWSEWNGRFRDTVRRFSIGSAAQLGDLGWRLTGSADLYGEDGRSPYNSVNFITCHDGFTLWDLVSYNGKHNERNGDGNRDGADQNNSWNCGIEGPTDDAAVLQLRRRLVKNFALELMVASGTPMMLGGDEFLRTQQGNNNAYCQDNEIGWFDWDAAAAHADMTAFWRKAIALTRRYPILQRRKFPIVPDLRADQLPALTWFGTDLGAPRWNDPEARTLCAQLDGASAPSAAGDYLLFVILNAHFESQWVQLPAPRDGKRWLRVVDTSLPAGDDFMDPGHEVPIEPPDHYIANPRSTVILVAR